MAAFVGWLFFTTEGLMTLAGVVLFIAITWTMRGGGGGRHRR